MIKRSMTSIHITALVITISLPSIGSAASLKSYMSCLKELDVQAEVVNESAGRLYSIEDRDYYILEDSRINMIGKEDGFSVYTARGGTFVPFASNKMHFLTANIDSREVSFVAFPEQEGVRVYPFHDVEVSLITPMHSHGVATSGLTKKTRLKWKNREMLEKTALRAEGTYPRRSKTELRKVLASGIQARLNSAAEAMADQHASGLELLEQREQQLVTEAQRLANEENLSKRWKVLAFETIRELLGASMLESGLKGQAMFLDLTADREFENVLDFVRYQEIASELEKVVLAKEARKSDRSVANNRNQPVLNAVRTCRTVVKDTSLGIVHRHRISQALNRIEALASGKRVARTR